MRCRLHTNIWTQTRLNCWIHYYTLCSYLIQSGIKEKENLMKTLTKQTSLPHSSKELQPNSNKESKRHDVCLLYCKPNGLRGWPLTHCGHWKNFHQIAHEIFKCIFWNENIWISLNISLKFVSRVWMNNIPALVQRMAWRRPVNKPLCKPMMVRLLTHIHPASMS